MMKKLHLAILLGFLAMFSCVSLAWSQETGFIRMLFTRKPPSSLDAFQANAEGTITFTFTQLLCADMDTGRILSCPFTHEIKGLKEPDVCPPSSLSSDECVANNGGHEHDFADHPIVEPRSSGALQLILPIQNPPNPMNTQFKIVGETEGSFALLQHPLPQAAGVIIAESTITAPPGYICGFDCFTMTQKKWVQTIEVGLPAGFGTSLQELVASSDPRTDPFALTGQTISHPFNHFGIPRAVTKLRVIAQDYKQRSGTQLSINDISLPRGGVFDLCGVYKTIPKAAFTCADAQDGGHLGHRDGTSADIDRRNDIACDDDIDLLVAVTAAGATRECESGLTKGRKHVDIH